MAACRSFFPDASGAHAPRGVVEARRRADRRAVAYARSHRAPAVEGYPVDNQGAKVDLTRAYVGTRAAFERAGFRKAADTRAVSGGFPRVLMRWTPNSSAAPPR